MEKRRIITIISAAVVVGGAGYFTYTSIRNKNEKNQIFKILDSDVGSYGGVEDFSDVFAGDAYINKIKLKYPTIIKLKDTYVTDARKELYDAIRRVVGWGDDSGFGTNEEAIKAVFRSLKDKIQIAQVAQSYRNNYKINLLEALKGEMDVKSDDMKELFNIIKAKPNFRVN